MPTALSMARMTCMAYNLGMGGAGGGRAASLGSSAWGGRGASTYFNAPLAKEYASVRKTFDAEFSGTMDSLKKSSDALKNTNFDVGGEAAISRTTREDGSVTVTKSDALKDALKAVERFASDYNDAIDFFDGNASGSACMRNVAESFGDAAYFAKSYEKIGLATDGSGRMKIDEDALTEAITKRPKEVERLLGKGGLASRADAHIAYARSQEARLFSSVMEGAGGAYGGLSYGSYGFSGQSLSRLASYAAAGSLLNLYA